MAGAAAHGSEAELASREQEALRVAVIGAGRLGIRIAAEMLLLGVRVSVHDRGLRRQRELDQKVWGAIQSLCQATGLLELAGLGPPPAEGVGPWMAVEGEAGRQARLCTSVAQAVAGADLVLEAVPDRMETKARVFAEAVAAAPTSALLATNTLSLPLEQLQAAVRLVSGQAPRIVGLRFLAPVCFVPFVEITLTARQMSGADRHDLICLLHRLRKLAFRCSVEGGAEDAAARGSRGSSAVALNTSRFRLDPTSAARRQRAEAKLRRAHREEEPARLRTRTMQELLGYAEERCCVCLDAEPSVANTLCGHCVLCDACAEELLARGQAKCPICCARFMPAVRAEAQRPQ